MRPVCMGLRARRRCDVLELAVEQQGQVPGHVVATGGGGALHSLDEDAAPHFVSYGAELAQSHRSRWAFENPLRRFGTLRDSISAF